MKIVQWFFLILISMPFFSAEASVVDDTAQALVADMLKQPSKGVSSAQELKVLVVPFEGASQNVSVLLETSVVRALGGRKRWKVWSEALLKQGYPDVVTEGLSEEGWRELGAALGVHWVVYGRLEARGNGFHVFLRSVGCASGEAWVSSQVFLPYTGEPHDIEDQHADAQLRRLADRVAWGLDRIDGELKYQKFAVLPLDETDASSEKAHAGVVLSARLADVLRSKHGLMVLSWSDMQGVLREEGFKHSAQMSDPAYVERMCERLHVQGVVFGTVYTSEHKAHMHVQVQSGLRAELLVSEEAHIALQELFGLSRDALELRSTWGAVARSAVLPGWGQWYQKQRTKSVLWMSAEVLAAGAAGALHVLAKREEQRYTQAGFGASEAFQAREEASQRYKERNIVLWALLGLHVLNTVDALLFGGEH
jgi:TolB-like protein